MENSNFDTFFSSSIKTESIVVLGTLNSLHISAYNDTIKGPDIHTNPKCAVTKQYFNDSAPTGPVGSIQVNREGSFYGSSEFIYTGSGPTGKVMLTTSLTVGDVIISDDTIKYLAEPVGSTDISTKNYVDKYFTNFNLTTYSSSATIGASSILNGVILSSASLLMPDAVSIINEVGQNKTTSINIINTNTNNNIVITPDPSINMDVITIFPYYEYNGLLVTGTTDVNVITKGLSWTVNYINNLFTQTGFNTEVPFRVTENLWRPGPSAEVTDSNYTYTLLDVNKGIIIRNPTSSSLDIIDSFSTNQIFSIRNDSANNIQLQPTGSWTFTSTTILPNTTFNCAINGYTLDIL